MQTTLNNQPKERQNAGLTTQPIQAGACSDYRREWGRTEHVDQTYGIKRGTLYNLHADGKINGKVLRVRGQLKGVRLWDMDSIRRFIESQSDCMEESGNEKTPVVELGQIKLS
jgi:hypothetical protein